MLNLIHCGDVLDVIYSGQNVVDVIDEPHRCPMGCLLFDFVVCVTTRKTSIGGFLTRGAWCATGIFGPGWGVPRAATYPWRRHGLFSFGKK